MAPTARNPIDHGKKDSLERGDPDCLKALSGKDRPVFLSEKMPKAAERSAEAIKEAVCAAENSGSM